MTGDNRQLVKKWTSWVWEITSWSWRLHANYRSFSKIYRIHPNLIKENRRMWTCNWLDLETLGSWLVMPKTKLRERERERDSHLFNITSQTWPPISLWPWFIWNVLSYIESESLKLILVSNELQRVTPSCILFGVLCWMNEKYAHTQ